MGFFDRILRKKDGVPTLIGRKLSKVVGPKKKQFKAICMIKYDGQPLRKFEVFQNAYTKAQAEERLKSRLEVKVVRVFTYKTKKK